MDKKIKKIIAREGLIILGTIFIGILTAFAEGCINPGWTTIGFFFGLFAYPVYLLIRFIVWSIKTLREK